MTRLLARFVVLFVAVFTLVPAADAQMVGDWDSDLGPFRLDIQRSSSNPAPNWVVARTRHEVAGEIILEGGVRNLVWEGQWFYYEGRPITGMRRCARRDGIAGRPTLVHGRFRVTFNAAESAFTGTWIACDGRGPERVLQFPFNGVRRNTVGAAAPRTVDVPGGGVSPNPEGDGARMRGGRFFRGSADLRKILIGRMALDFSIKPYKVSAGQSMQIDVRAPQSQRPVTVIFEAFEPIPTDKTGLRYMIRETGPSFQLGLPFRGVPSVGSSLFVTLPGAVCRSDFWLVRLAMSDGTVTGIAGVAVSLCGPSRLGEATEGERIEGTRVEIIPGR